VFPSFMEGFGLPPLEAMACGVPVIATNRTAVPEILGDAPVYVDPADVTGITEAMQRLVDDKPLREGLIQKGYWRVAGFTPARTGEAMEGLLEELPASRD